MYEIWKPVVDFELSYEVSNLGKIRSKDRMVSYKDGRESFLKKGRLLRCHIGNHGYKCTTLNSVHRKLLHRLIAEAFLEKTAYKETVNHINGNKLDNSVNNLEWATYKQNNNHARKTGLNNQHSINCNLTKFPDKIIKAIINIHNKFNLKYKDIAELFDVSTSHVGEIIRKESRKK